jgi:hypothetical protein
MPWLTHKPGQPPASRRAHTPAAFIFAVEWLLLLYFRCERNRCSAGAGCQPSGDYPRACCGAISLEVDPGAAFAGTAGDIDHPHSRRQCALPKAEEAALRPVASHLRRVMLRA